MRIHRGHFVAIMLEIVSITIVMYVVDRQSNAAPVLRYFYLLPIAHAALYFGLVGSMSVALLTNLLFIPLLAVSIRQAGAFAGPTVELGVTLILLPTLAFFAGSAWGQIRRQQELYRFLSGMGDLFGKSLPRTDILTQILQHGATLLEAASAEILLIEDHQAAVVASWGLDGSENSASTTPYEHSLAQHILTDNRLWSTISLEYDLHFERTHNGPRIESVLAVPLRLEGKPVGVLGFYNRPGGFGKYEQAALEAIGSKVEVVLENYRHLERVAEQERLQHEFRLAAEVQQRLLPTTMPVIAGYRLYGRTTPARDVGGDFYCCVPLPDQRWYIAVGDVSGKGVVGALFMAVASSLLEMHLHYTHDSSALLTTMNPTFYERMATQKLNTALAHIILEPASGQIQVGNAGLIAPLIRHCAHGHCRYVDVVGLPLGAMQQANYTEQQLEMLPGDVLVLVSDGVVEAHNPQRAMFGLERLSELIQAAPDVTANVLGEYIFQTVEGFLATAEHADDMTVVVIERVAA